MLNNKKSHFRQPCVLLLLLNLTCAGAEAGEQSAAKGFIEDSHLVLTNRNYYFNHDFKDGINDGRDWAHALLFNYSSGFTQGMIGVGVDAIANIVIKLDEKGDGTGNLRRNGDRQTESFSHFGAAAKARVSNTVVRYGVQSPVNPMLADVGSRIQPLTAYGLSLRSNEVDGLLLEAGHFTAGTGWNSNSRTEPLKAFYANVEADRIDYLGGKYNLSDRASLSLYAANVPDLWRQYYAAWIYAYALDDTQSVGLDFNLYRTEDEGRAKLGQIDTTAWSLAVNYRWGAHKLTLAQQQIHGDEPMDYIGQGSENSPSYSIYLANSAQTSDFNGPGEKSTQLRYDLDMALYGVPGLTFSTRYIYGSGVDGRHADPSGAYAGRYAGHGSEREYGGQVTYVVQGGPAKGLSVQLRQYFHRGDSLGLSSNQTRLMISHPFNFF